MLFAGSVHKKSPASVTPGWSDSKKLVDAVHKSLPEKVANAAFVNSDGLKHKGDKVHFDAESLREFGRRYAAAFAEMAK